MTTIAWDGRTMAADRMLSVGTTPVKSPTSKIHRITFSGKPAIVGGAGSSERIHKFIDWLKNGQPSDSQPTISDGEDWVSIVIANEDGVYYFGNSINCIHLGLTKWAIGSGADFALGAMWAGSSAKKAIEISTQLDSSTGMDIDVINLPKAKR